MINPIYTSFYITFSSLGFTIWTTWTPAAARLVCTARWSWGSGFILGAALGTWSLFGAAGRFTTRFTAYFTRFRSFNFLFGFSGSCLPFIYFLFLRSIFLVNASFSFFSASYFFCKESFSLVTADNSSTEFPPKKVWGTEECWKERVYWYYIDFSYFWYTIFI